MPRIPVANTAMNVNLSLKWAESTIDRELMNTMFLEIHQLTLKFIPKLFDSRVGSIKTVWTLSELNQICLRTFSNYSLADPVYPGQNNILFLTLLRNHWTIILIKLRSWNGNIGQLTLKLTYFPTHYQIGIYMQSGKRIYACKLFCI